MQNASVVGVIKGTKTKAGTRKVELTEEALYALTCQKPFTFMKDAMVFEDQKLKNHGQALTQSERKPGCQVYEGQE